MKTIVLKYHLSPPDQGDFGEGVTTYIEAPRDFYPMSVHEQHGHLTVWGASSEATVKDRPKLVCRHAFLVVPTGLEVDLQYIRFLGTVLLHGGTLVLHVFHQQRSR